MVPVVAVLEAAAVVLLIVTFTTDVAVWPAAIVLAIAALVVLVFRRIVVTVDRSDLVVRYASPVSFRHRIARRDIETAEVVDVRPVKWGGWGYRGSRLLFGRAALVIRGGPGLRVVTKKGKAFTVTVDEPEGAVAALGF